MCVDVHSQQPAKGYIPALHWVRELRSNECNQDNMPHSETFMPPQYPMTDCALVEGQVPLSIEIALAMQALK